MIYRVMLLNKFNKQPLRKKLLIIYLIGFLIPIISINIIFSYNLYMEQKEFQEKKFSSSMDKIKLIIETEMEQNLVQMYNIFINNQLYTFLETDYRNVREYLGERRNIRDIDRTITNIRLQNNQVEIFTKNKTIPNDSVFKKMDVSVRNSAWYRDFTHTKKSVDIYFNKEDPDYISIIKLLNYRSSNRLEHIIKINIPISKINEDILNIAINEEFSIISPTGDIVLVNKNSLTNFQKYNFTFDNIEALDQWTIEGRLENLGFLESASFLDKDILLISIILIVLIGTMGIYILARSFYGRIYGLTLKIKDIRDGIFKPIELNPDYMDEITDLAISYNVMTNKIDELINEITDAKLREKNIEIVKRKAQINALRSQINPHYLFNVLESIRMKSIIKGEKETGDIIKHLSKSFRHIISWDSNIISIGEELEIAKDFLIVQKYRFGDKLDYEIECEDMIRDFKIPKLTLQPFIENSCIHGIEKSSENGKIKISISKSHDNIVCKIRDNGIGITSNDLEMLKDSINYFDLESTHIGFSNAYWRLKNNFPNMVFDIETEVSKGTEITITLPTTEDFDD